MWYTFWETSASSCIALFVSTSVLLPHSWHLVCSRYLAHLILPPYSYFTNWMSKILQWWCIDSLIDVPLVGTWKPRIINLILHIVSSRSEQFGHGFDASVLDAEQDKHLNHRGSGSFVYNSNSVSSCRSLLVYESLRHNIVSYNHHCIVFIVSLAYPAMLGIIRDVFSGDKRCWLKQASLKTG